MIKVLHVLHQSPPNISGSSTRTKLLLKWVDSADVKSIAITSPFQAPFSSKKAISTEVFEGSGTKVYRTHLISGLSVGDTSSISTKAIKALTLPYFIYRLFTAVLNEKPSVLHAHATFICAISALIVGKATKTPVIYEIRSLWFENSNFKAGRVLRKLSKILERFCIVKSDHVVAISDGLRKFAESAGQKGSSITVIRNGVDDDEVEEMSGSNVNLGGGIKKFAYIGSVIELEGLDYVIQAVHLAVNKGLELDFHIYGDGPAREALEAAAKQAGLPIIFHGRFTPSDAHKIYREIDIVVNYRKSNSVSETVTPLKPLEALLYKKGLICADVGGYREILDGKYAKYVAPDSPEKLAEAMIEVALDQCSLPCPNEGFKFVTQERLWSANGARYREIYKKAVNGL